MYGQSGGSANAFRRTPRDLLTLSQQPSNRMGPLEPYADGRDQGSGEYHRTDGIGPDRCRLWRGGWSGGESLDNVDEDGRGWPLEPMRADEM